MIKIKNLCKAYDDKVLFKNFNLEIEDAGFVIISGNSGCGKTTLLNMIGGIEDPDKGRITVDNVVVTEQKNRKLYFREIVGFLFQNFALLENKTVRENLEMIKKSSRTDTGIEEALEKVGLLSAADKKVYKLSGGEQQRVALARLMIKKCSLILADEPTGSLDAENSKIVMDILHDFNRTGKTVLIVTHSQRIVDTEKYVIRL